jgi:hypothetical protein
MSPWYRIPLSLTFRQLLSAISSNFLKDLTMATWNELVGFLANNYTCTINGSIITLPYTFQNGRTQSVYVTLGGNENQGEWVFISSAIAEISHVGQLEAICRVAHSKICGGIVIDGNHIVIRDSMPLLNLDDTEINSSISLVYP